MKKGVNKNETQSVDDAYLNLLGAIMQSNTPEYYLCLCAYKWASIAGVDILPIYEKARKGTAFETVPFQVYPHDEWVKFKLKQRASTKP